MIVKLRQPRRELEMPGARTVNQLLDSLGMNRESYLVIRNGTLAPGDARLDDHGGFPFPRWPLSDPHHVRLLRGSGWIGPRTIRCRERRVRAKLADVETWDTIRSRRNVRAFTGEPARGDESFGFARILAFHH